jgi:antitoxin HicB
MINRANRFLAENKEKDFLGVLVVRSTRNSPASTRTTTHQERNRRLDKMIFRVVLRPDLEDGGFNVSCPALPGCHSQGETQEEAIENIREAIVGCLDILNERAQARAELEEVVEVAIN